MISVSNTTAQTLTAGQSISFDRINLHTGCAECFRNNTPSVKLRANGIYEINFKGDIAAGAATTAVQLAIQIGGVTIPESRMIATSTASGDVYTVSVSIPVKNTCGDYDRITVTNVGTASLTVSANSVLYIRRVS